jgi:hypothetical protein
MGYLFIINLWLFILSGIMLLGAMRKEQKFHNLIKSLAERYINEHYRR